MTADGAPRVLDTVTVLADLAAWWGDLKPSLPHAPDMSMLTDQQQRDVRAQELDAYMTAMAGYRDREPRRIAGGKWDQEVPEGTQNPYWEIIRQLPLDDISVQWQGRPEPTLHWFGGRRREDFKWGKG